jgi:isoleucyl-tRNA synthetase
MTLGFADHIYAAASSIHIPTSETKVMDYWTEIDAFKTSQKLNEGKPEFTFYDGPPFATGKPHYGHLLAGTIKVSPLHDNTYFRADA